MATDRRSFLKILGGGAAAVATAKVLPAPKVDAAPVTPPAPVKAAPMAVPYRNAEHFSMMCCTSSIDISGFGDFSNWVIRDRSDVELVRG